MEFGSLEERKEFVQRGLKEEGSNEREREAGAGEVGLEFMESGLEPGKQIVRPRNGICCRLQFSRNIQN